MPFIRPIHLCLILFLPFMRPGYLDLWLFDVKTILQVACETDKLFSHFGNFYSFSFLCLGQAQDRRKDGQTRCTVVT